MKIRVLFLLAILVLTACNKIDNPMEKVTPTSSSAPTSTPRPPKITPTITLNLDDKMNINDKVFFLAGDAATSIATVTSGASVNITSSDESVVSIDGSGNIVPVGPGTATITIAVKENLAFTAATKTVTIVVGRKVSLADETGTEFVAQNGDQITGTAPNTMHLSIADGALVRFKNATIQPTSGTDVAGIICAGNATLILEGVNSVKGKGDKKAGIQAGPEGSTLIIDGEGKIIVETDGQKHGAGIGCSSNETCGDIVIRNSDITVSSRLGAAIGAGIAISNDNISKCGNITITGGKVIANSEGGAAIGTGDAYDTNCQSLCGDIFITGGEIEATTLSASTKWIGAAIGTGHPRASTAKTLCGNIKISNGKITATTGSDTKESYAAAIGTAGTSNTVQCGNIIIEGGTIIATSINNSENYGGAGIGTGFISSGLGICGNISISGGTITANGGHNAAGIGTGVAAYDGSSVTCGDITISGGTVTAHSHTTSSDLADIGLGGCWGTGTKTVGTITLDATNGANYTKVSDTNYKHN